MRSSTQVLALFSALLLFAVHPGTCQTEQGHADFWSRDDPNEDFLGLYPAIHHSQNTGELEEVGSYNEEVLLAFLVDWMPLEGGSS